VRRRDVASELDRLAASRTGGRELDRLAASLTGARELTPPLEALSDQAPSA
jgi:hypothetical protein